MKKLLLAMSLLAPMTAMADIDLYSPYVGASVSASQYDFETGGVSASPYAIKLRAGVAFNDVLGLEAQVGTGVTDDKFAPGEKMSIQSEAGIFLRGAVEITPRLVVYGLAGYMTQRLALTDALGETKENIDDGAWGLGAEYGLESAGWSITGGFLQALKGNGVNNIQYDAGVTYRY